MSSLQNNIYAEQFIKFINDITQRLCTQSAGYIRLSADYDLTNPENHERFFLEGWNALGEQWASIESIPTYKATLLSLLERWEFLGDRSGRKQRILSLGSGPSLYEIFLAYWLNENKKSARIFAVDYAEGMISFARSVMNSNIRIGKKKLASLGDTVSFRVRDMTDLKEFREKIDIVVCNNSLQWVFDWKKSLQQMRNAMNPQGQGILLLVIHPHPMKIGFGTDKESARNQIIERDHVTPEMILDELAHLGFSPDSLRILKGPKGSGQDGASLDRMLIKCTVTRGEVRSWRELVRNPKFSVKEVSLT